MKQRNLLSAAGLALILLGSCERAALPLTHSTTVKTKSTLLPESSVWTEKRRAGIDFVAAGITPSEWSMDVDFSKQIVFKPLSGSTLVADMPKPQPSGKNSGVLLDARVGTGLVAASNKKNYLPKNNRIKVFIEPTVTRDNLTGRLYAYTVRVENNGRKYVGYGAFIKGSDRLNGTWALETFKGQRVRPGQFPNNALPELTINLEGNEVEGSTGCNKLKGEVSAEGDHVKFVVKTTTNKKCSNPFEEDYLAALAQTTLFRIGKDRLTLLVDGQYVLTMKPAEK
ncbi:META domain-containing protein [Fibrella aquatilis]|uniref:META domain-containing protein n=1 Tax=Fibrella aquatilis TaxID=2817059 RepID=A0A939G9H4_9BACT|nr:META domain-containing protein [Fibrella aquatilis]MBO0934729.1 META domain-containing protein [Fibrella aquatilis]